MNDQFYRLTFQLESIRRCGWLHLTLVQRQLEGQRAEVIEDSPIFKARNCPHQKNALLPCHYFTSCDDWFDLTPCPVIPDLADVPGS
jgi:hypothetical protein